ncbi:acid--CoA ligase [Bradyrhizobium sp. SK17]|jgi:acyl-CoA synthetase (AMP-forming)/AMP-acid ligase II|uniref:class I adenylate-forming enzyme family protein n=1 Tax=Bradyrhizobium sp. SK17 TaxID=2057741 RepID=UPI000C312EBE|nr:class I adenylate-forming enzyme family protein [Bradyrhizobium sp. SK17]AUC97834.1 acid--CoA ligase [Bradyrhizobium sp. SK17]
MATEFSTQIAAGSGIGTVGALFEACAELHASRPAIEHRGRRVTYGELLDRVRRLTSVLIARGMQRGDRLGLLSRNRPEYLEIELAAANLGIITACLNWRLSERELTYCIELVSPKLILVEADLAANLPSAAKAYPILEIGPQYESELALQDGRASPRIAQLEDGLVILYTSGTTGLPKGAVISHRAMVMRALVFSSELGIAPHDTFVAWTPLFHMASTDHALATLLRGGTVIVIDGFQLEPLLTTVSQHDIGWLVLIPGMVEAFVDGLKTQHSKVKGVRVCGAMADLVPPHTIAEVTELLRAPYLNSFGSTETGLPPATRALIPPGKVPTSLSKRQNAFCEIKLVDTSDNEVAPGEPGELAIRSPTLFSGYWQADETNARDFRGGWFHMGDVFRRNPDGSLDFIDRAKYMIKSGGENIYPAEIERVLLSDDRITEVAVVRAADARWGEAPVAFVACRDDAAMTEAELAELCRRELAGYKRPREFRLIAFAEFPRSTSGKVQRHELERRLKAST